MKLTTLCYIEKNNKYLMLHRTKKIKDINQDKWLGIGGHFEEGESPHDCVLREVKEETGLTLTKCTFRGIVTFILNGYETEYMHLFTSDEFEGELIDCDEGILEWIPKKDVLSLNVWEGDKLFLNRLQNEDTFFSLKLEYNNDKLVSYKFYD